MLITQIPNLNYAELGGFALGIRQEEERNRFALSRIIPNRDNPGGTINYKVRKGSLRAPNAAKFRAWDTEAGTLKRQGFSIIGGELAPLSMKMPITEEQEMRLRGVQDGDKPMLGAIFDDTRTLTRSLAARAELLRGEVLVDAAVTLNENGVVDTVDFGRDASVEKSVAGGAQWTLANKATMTSLADERQWISDYYDLNGFYPAFMMTSKKRVDAMVQSDEYRDLGQRLGITPSLITTEIFNQIRSAFDLPPIVIYDTKVRVDDVEVRVIAEDKVLWLPPATEEVGALLHAPTAEAVKLRGTKVVSADDMTQLAVVNMASDEPVQTWTKVSAVCFPAMPNPNFVMVADVA